MRRITTLFLLSLPIFLVPVLALAQAANCQVDCPPDEFCIPNPLRWCNIHDLIGAVVDFIFWIAIAVAPIMIVYAAFLFMTSAGNKNKVTQAKKLIFYTLLGVVIVYMARILVQMINQLLGVD